MKERAGIQSVEVGFALLDRLAIAEGPLMLRDLAAAAGMSAAKAHRYLVSFQRLQLVVQDAASTRYDLGPASLRLGLASLSRLDSVKLARERMPALREQLGFTVALAVWGNQGPTLVHWEESPLAMTILRLGDVMPLLSSATGRCFAAYLQPEVTSPLFEAEMERARRQQRQDVPLDWPQVKAMLHEVRERGLARVVDVLLPGVVGFCAPVFDADGHIALGIVSLGPRSSFDPNWDGAIALRLKQVAANLSNELGWRGS